MTAFVICVGSSLLSKTADVTFKHVFLVGITTVFLQKIPNCRFKKIIF